MADAAVHELAPRVGTHPAPVPHRDRNQSPALASAERQAILDALPAVAAGGGVADGERCRGQAPILIAAAVVFDSMA